MLSSINFTARLGLAVLLALLCHQSSAQQVVWRIGEPDHDFAELAIAGKWQTYAEHFAEAPVFVVGKDKAALRWP